MMNSTGPQSDPASEPVTLPPVPYTTEELWDDGYPTDAALDLINSFTGTHAELFALVRMLWSPYGVMHVTLTEDGSEISIVLATGGWSGNESIIGALENSFYVQMRLWHSATRGGRHEYRIRAGEWNSPLPANLMGTRAHVLSAEALVPSLAAVDEFVAAGAVSDAVANRTRTLLTQILVDVVVQPTVAPSGEDALSVYWAAEEMSLTAIVHSGGHWWSVRFGDEHTTGEGARFPVASFVGWLGEFSGEVYRRRARGELHRPERR
jgi:hypothetical protein